MSQPTIFLDLDRTLYKTHAGGKAIWQKISQMSPHVDTTSSYDRQQEYYRHQGDAYAYDFTAHLQALNLDPSTVYRMLRHCELADGRFEYEGAKELIAWAKEHGDVTILTYGIDDYQRLKAALCPSLQDVEIITTLESKADYLQNTTNAYLIDDKPLGSELPDGVRFIQACLERQSSEGASWPVATSLSQALTLLQENTA